MNLIDNDLSGEIIDSCYLIHSQLGPGLFESVYEKILTIELRRKGLSVENQVSIPVKWRRNLINDSLRADLIVENKIIIEIKSVSSLSPVHHKQLLTYLKLTHLRLGLLINFNEALLKTGIKRIVNG
ncbi:MAG TPA: GxxExxY protein [Anditalea sp.]|nr:GxxExxY protein [Anditalea sp.]